MIVDVKSRISAGAKVQSMEQYQEIYRRSLDEPQKFWGEQAKRLNWFHTPHTPLDYDLEAVDFSWYGGGRLNASFNCVDRHLATHPEKTAIIWAADEPGEYRHISYRELKHEVCKLANALLAHGVRAGDRVASTCR